MPAIGAMFALTTAASLDEARRIANYLVDRRVLGRADAVAHPSRFTFLP